MAVIHGMGQVLRKYTPRLVTAHDLPNVSYNSDQSGGEGTEKVTKY